MIRSRRRRAWWATLVTAGTILAAGVVTVVAAGTAQAADLTVTVSGNRFLRGGQEIKLHGVNRSGTQYACIQDWGIFDGPSDQASVDLIASWGAKVVRVPLNADCWNPKASTPRTYTGEVYRSAVQDYVAKINAAGMNAILELHWTSRGPNGKALDQDHMPETGNAYDFWYSVASAFKSNRSVLFELFNEPRDVDSACWLNGCWFDGYQTAGMQEMVNAVRDTGAENVIIATGLGWGNWLGPLLSHRPSDPRDQLAAGWHVYNFAGCNSRSCYDGEPATVAAQLPVITTELGQDDDSDWFVKDFADWAGGKSVSYVFWSWNTAGPPVLLRSYDGTPTGYGAGAKAILQGQGATSGGGTTGTGQLRGQASDRCLDVDDGRTADGTKVQIWACDAGSANQKWEFAADGSVRGLGKCLDVAGAGTGNGSGVHLWSCHGGGNQKWEYTSAGQIRNPASGRCLDVSGAGTGDGTAVQIWDCHSGGNQKWTRVG